jgi:hypothetical protein
MKWQRLQRQSESVSHSTPIGSLWERHDPWGRQEPALLVREMSGSAETAYHNDMYVTSKMANRWKEIHWWRIDKRCFGRPRMGRTPKYGRISVSPRMSTENPGRNGQESSHTTTTPVVREISLSAWRS